MALHSGSKVSIVKWWMAHYGSGTPKRHWAFSNAPDILGLDRGKLTGWKKVPEHKQTARRYMDAKGKKRYQGTSQLRKTEHLDIT